MTTTTPDSFDDFLAQISASLTSSSGEAALRRINTQRNLRLLLDEVVQQRHDLQIRIITDSRLAGEPGADILIQIDDYDIRLEILDTPDNICRLNVDQIKRCREIFEENPSTETIVLTWTTNDLLSIQLTLGQLDQLLLGEVGQNQPEASKLFDISSKVQSLGEVLTNILESRVKVWEKMLVQIEGGGGSSSDIRKLFEKHLLQCLAEERSRSFKIEERKAAAEKLSEEQVRDFISPILDQALNGEKLETIAKRLAQLPKRGAK